MSRIGVHSLEFHSSIDRLLVRGLMISSLPLEVNAGIGKYSAAFSVDHGEDGWEEILIIALESHDGHICIFETDVIDELSEVLT